MTKETKIGLLVGLAFIILFAIILSEKGANPRDPKSPVFSPLETSGPSIASGPQRPLHDAGRLPIDSQLALINPGAGTPREDQLAQATFEPEASSSTELPSSLAGLLGPQEARADSSESTPTHAESSIEQLIDRSPIGPEYTPPSTTISLSPVRDEPPAPTIQIPASLEPRLEPKPPVKVVAEHVVAPGESLSKIAAKYYGRATQSRVQAIFENNRQNLSSVAAVKSGAKLRIPDLGEGFEPAPGFAVENMRPVSATMENRIRVPLPVGDETPTGSEPGEIDIRSPVKTAVIREENPKPTRFQWYEVRRRDTLAGIARRELGSERMLNDLFRINRDLLTNKNMLKPGMRLRVPLRTSNIPGASTVLSASRSSDGEP